MKDKICTKCQVSKPYSEFIFLKKENRYRGKCKSCRREEYRLKMHLINHDVKMTNATKFMKTVREYRKKLKIPIRIMAESCQLNVITYSEYENGAATPNVFQKQVIKNYLKEQILKYKSKQKANN